MTNSKRAASPVSGGSSRTSRPSKRSKTTSKTTKSESDSGTIGGIPIKFMNNAGRAITRCCDMFCDVDEVVRLAILAKQTEKSANENNSEGADERPTQTPESFDSLKRAYDIITYEIPGIESIIEDPSQASILKAILTKISKAISSTRSCDSSQLQGKVSTYILKQPGVDVMNPPITAETPRSEFGLNHIQIAGYLCPVDTLVAFKENAEETQNKLKDGEINMSASELPAFLWEDNGAKYNNEDIFSGLFRGYYLERVARHIFTGPSTALGCEPHRGRRPCNAIILRMEKVEAAHIAYAAVLARFGISSETCWMEDDGHFNYREFYYIIMNLIDKVGDTQWRKELIEHYNMLFFKNKAGRKAKISASTELEPGGFLGRMQAQAAARAAQLSNQNATLAPTWTLPSNAMTNSTSDPASLAVGEMPPQVQVTPPTEHNLSRGSTPQPELIDTTNMHDTHLGLGPEQQSASPECQLQRPGNSQDTERQDSEVLVAKEETEPGWVKLEGQGLRFFL